MSHPFSSERVPIQFQVPYYLGIYGIGADDLHFIFDNTVGTKQVERLDHFRIFRTLFFILYKDGSIRLVYRWSIFQV